MRGRPVGAGGVALVAAGTVAGAGPLVWWVDCNFVRDLWAGTLAISPLPLPAEPAWTPGLILQRVEHDARFGVGVVTLGMALLLLINGRFRPRRGRLGPGAVQLAVVALVGLAVTGHFLLTAPPFALSEGLAVGLNDLWSDTMPGVVIGAWVVVGRRRGRRWRRDWLDRSAGIVPWLWLI